jgi:hypothetical protein
MKTNSSNSKHCEIQAKAATEVGFSKNNPCRRRWKGWGSVFTSQGCCDKVPHMGGLTTETYCLVFLEATRPRSKCCRAMILQKPPGRRLPLLWESGSHLVYSSITLLSALIFFLLVSKFLLIRTFLLLIQRTPVWAPLNLINYTCNGHSQHTLKWAYILGGGGGWGSGGHNW